MPKIAVGILGATGTVGQRFIQLLETHPEFYVEAIGASSRSAGKTYKEACNWKMDTPIPEGIKDMIVSDCEPEYFKRCKVIFSGLDASVAGDVEFAFLEHEFAVFSNAKNHRMNPVVPLIVPIVNPDHFALIHHQQSVFGKKKGFLITNANCSTTGLVSALKPLKDAFGPLSKVVVTTMQAISGAGYPGVPSLDILGNVVPYISGEESKMETEAAKILGSVSSNAQKIDFTDEMKISASCNRVPVIDGHTEIVFVEFASKPAPTVAQIISALESYKCEAQILNCHSAPKRSVVVMENEDRPQPRLDLGVEGGNGVLVGNVRKCNVFDVKFTLLVHNTILGAAGSSIMNAEIALKKGFIQ
jgi:aspartate-semialdehyde dehydrogenase